ncbi:MAG TPA: hypothetical protein VKT81_01510 [Bryobacteraceae bacterium]|nr:hypothetical protein [Bryobacteraceae bacterium]
MVQSRALRIVAGFLFAATGIAAVVGCALLFPGSVLEWLAQFNRPGMAAFQWMGRWAGLLLMMLAVGTASSAWGLLHGKKWAWWSAVILFSVNACGDLVSYFVTGDALRSGSGILICAIFLVLLFNADKDGRVKS